MTERPKQASIANEIRDALKTHGHLSSADLIPLCASAFDSTDICRVLYDLRRSGSVEVADERIVRGKGKPIKFYKWIGAETPAKVNHYLPKPKTQPKPKPVIESIEDEPVSAQPPASITPEQEEALVAALSATLTTEIPVTIEEEIAMDEAQHIVPPPTEPKWTPFASDPEQPISFDPVEIALVDLLDMADEALLVYAESKLSGDPLWVAQRKMAGHAHRNLCDYRVMRSMEAK